MELIVTDSYAIDRAIELAVENKIDIVISDYPSPTNIY